MPADIGALSNPYDSLWDPKYKGKTAVIDDWHTAMAMVLLRAGKTDVNTSNRPTTSRWSAISSTRWWPRRRRR